MDTSTRRKTALKLSDEHASITNAIGRLIVLPKERLNLSRKAGLSCLGDTTADQVYNALQELR
jgi:hypothetical protein